MTPEAQRVIQVSAHQQKQSSLPKDLNNNNNSNCNIMATATATTGSARSSPAHHNDVQQQQETAVAVISKNEHSSSPRTSQHHGVVVAVDRNASDEPCREQPQDTTSATENSSTTSSEEGYIEEGFQHRGVSGATSSATAAAGMNSGKSDVDRNKIKGTVANSDGLQDQKNQRSAAILSQRQRGVVPKTKPALGGDHNRNNKPKRPQPVRPIPVRTNVGAAPNYAQARNGQKINTVSQPEQVVARINQHGEKPDNRNADQQVNVNKGASINTPINQRSYPVSAQVQFPTAFQKKSQQSARSSNDSQQDHHRHKHPPTSSGNNQPNNHQHSNHHAPILQQQHQQYMSSGKVQAPAYRSIVVGHQQSNSGGTRSNVGSPATVPRNREGTSDSIPPLFERLFTSEESQDAKTYSRIMAAQNRRLIDLERAHDDLEARLEDQTKGRMDLEAELARQHRIWNQKYKALERDRDEWRNRVTDEQNKNEQLLKQINHKEKEIHRMIQHKVSVVFFRTGIF